MSRILYTIFAILFSTSLFAKEVNNFYINGINNSPDQYEFSRFELEKAFTDKYGHVLKNTAVLSAYNESMGFFPDLIESGIQKYNLEHLVSGLSGVGLMSSSTANQILTDVSDQYQRELLAKAVHFYLLLQDSEYRNRMYGSVSYIDNSADILLTGQGSTRPSQEPTIEEVRQFDKLAFLLDLGMSLGDLIELKLIIGVSSKFEDLTEGSQYFYDNMGGYVDQQRETEDKLKSEIFPTIENGGAVNVIAHSQGNLFANKILNDFNMPDHTRLLSVGSPSADLPVTGDFVNLREDVVVIKTKPNLGWNYSNIPNTIWMNDILVSDLINAFELGVANYQVYDDKQGHNFVKAYLKPGSQAREKILDTFAHHYLEMGGNTVPRINNIQGNTVCENPLINLVGETQALEYDVLFYGDKCLFFRDDYLTVFNLDNQTIESTYDGTYYSPEHEEYKIFRKFVNNLAIVEGNSGLAAEFGVTLSSSGNIGCTVTDNCTNGEITTAQQCENMFTALTGVNPSAMNVSNVYTNINSNNCDFVINDREKYIQYSSNGNILINNNLYLDITLPDNPQETIYTLYNIDQSFYEINIYNQNGELVHVIGTVYLDNNFNYGFVSGDQGEFYRNVDISIDWRTLQTNEKKYKLVLEVVTESP